MAKTLEDRFTGVPVRALRAVLVAGALAVIVLRAWASVSTGWTGMTLPEATAGVVSDVRPGSLAWLDGIRVGDPFDRDPADGAVIIHTATTRIGLATGLPRLPLQATLVAVAIGVLGLAARRVVPAVGALMLLGAVLAAGDALLGWLPMPMIALVLVGPSCAVALLSIDRVRAGSPIAIAGLATALITGAAMAALAFAPEPPFSELWEASRLVPIGVAAILLLEAGIALGMQIHEARRSGDPAYLPVMRATAIGRRALRMTAEEERDRAAQRVHDQVLPGLALVLAGPATPPAERARVASIADRVRTAIMDDQLLVLRHEGLEDALRDVIDRAGIEASDASVVAEGAEGRPPWDVEVAAYRIAQEAINNARRHAGADRLRVRIAAHPRLLRMDVEDDGVGIDDKVAHGRPGHLGIRAMETHARDAGGRLTVERGASGGTRVTFRWPA